MNNNARDLVLYRNNLRTYNVIDCVVFLRTRDDFGGLSNMAAGFPIVINDCPIRTSEALYQACRFPHIADIQQKIIEARSPMTAKMISKRFVRYSRFDWNLIRLNVMRWCLQAKLAHNWMKFSELLLSTKNYPIVEQSRKDAFWGAKTAGSGKLVGINALGRLLMELREQVKVSEPEVLQLVNPLDVHHFHFLRRPIKKILSSRMHHNPMLASREKSRLDRHAGGTKRY